MSENSNNPSKKKTTKKEEPKTTAKTTRVLYNSLEGGDKAFWEISICCSIVYLVILILLLVIIIIPFLVLHSTCTENSIILVSANGNYSSGEFHTTIPYLHKVSVQPEDNFYKCPSNSK